MEIDPKIISLMQDQAISFLHLVTVTLMRPLGLLFGFIGITWAIGGTTSLIRTGIAFALAIPVMAYDSVNLLKFVTQTEYFTIFVTVIKEFGIGFTFGIIASIPFWIVQFGGALLDSYRGESNSGGQDPTGGEISTLSRYHVVVALLIFSSLGGLSMMIGEFYKTYQTWPLTAALPTLKGDSFSNILDLMTYIVIQGIVIAAPLLFIMIAVDFLALMCGKIAKGFSAMDLSFALKNLLTVLLLPIMAVVLVNVLQASFFKSSGIVSILKQVIQ